MAEGPPSTSKAREETQTRSVDAAPDPTYRRDTTPTSPRTYALLLASAGGALYLLAFWFHFPYGGGHIYSDIVTVFQNRLVNPNFSPANIPYVNTFVEYPPLTSLFIYATGVLGEYLPLSRGSGLIDNYYFYTVIFLTIPTLLMIPELVKICELLGVKNTHRRTFLFYVATPSFIFMVLLNWYIIGVYLATLGLRKYLQGSRWTSGAILGLSAGANLVTAAPALGLLVTARNWDERVRFGGAAISVYLLVNLPFVIVNRALWLSFWSFEQNWYIEGSWMLAFLNNESPLRHYIFPVLFAGLAAAILVRLSKDAKDAVTRRERARLAVRASWLFTFAYLFSSYVFTPQMNLMLLPFFVVAPVAKRYWEFLAFDVVNALVIVWGFSEPLLAFGINIPGPTDFGPIWVSPIQALAVLRSLWVGKFLIYDGVIRPNFISRVAQPPPKQPTREADWVAPRVRMHDDPAL
jgi:hypothetical protein